MLCFSNSNVLTHRFKFKTKVFLHWTLQVAAGICITGGLVSAVIRKIQRDKSHFKSYHAIFGLIAIILSLLTTKYTASIRQNWTCHIVSDYVWCGRCCTYTWIVYRLVQALWISDNVLCMLVGVDVYHTVHCLQPNGNTCKPCQGCDAQIKAIKLG